MKTLFEEEGFFLERENQPGVYAREDWVIFQCGQEELRYKVAKKVFVQDAQLFDKESAEFHNKLWGNKFVLIPVKRTITTG